MLMLHVLVLVHMLYFVNENPNCIINIGSMK